MDEFIQWMSILSTTPLEDETMKKNALKSNILPYFTIYLGFILTSKTKKPLMTKSNFPWNYL